MCNARFCRIFLNALNTNVCSLNNDLGSQISKRKAEIGTLGTLKVIYFGGTLTPFLNAEIKNFIFPLNVSYPVFL